MRQHEVTRPSSSLQHSISAASLPSHASAATLCFNARINSLFILLLMLVCLTIVPFSAFAAAAPATPVDPCADKMAIDASNNLAYCNCLTYPNGPTEKPNPAIALPLLQCFTDSKMVSNGSGKQYPRGLIPYATYKILTDSPLVTYFKPIMVGLMTLALALFGYGLFAGTIQNTKRDTFLLVLKFAGIYYFIFSAPTVYLGLLGVITQLCDAISAGTSAIPNALNPQNNFWGYCRSDGTGTVLPTTSNQMWGMWDCTLNYLVGFSGDSVKWVGVLMFAMLFMATLGTGITIAGLMIGAVIGVILLFARFLQTYVMAVLALSFMFFIGYLFVPMVLFGNNEVTKTKFSKWLNLCFGYILTPVVMMGYMCMMLIALDIVLFTGEKSLFERVEKGSRDNKYDANASESPFIAATLNSQPSFHSLLQTNFSAKSNAGIGACAAAVPELVVPSGVLGSAKLSKETGTDAEKNMPATANRVGFQLRGLNIGPCKNLLDGTPSTSTKQYPPGCTFGGVPGTGLAEKNGMEQWEYISGILNSSAAALVLIYVMHAVLGYLPSLVDGLVAQGSAAGSIAQTLTGSGHATSQKLTDSGMGMLSKGGGTLNNAMRKMIGNRGGGSS